MRCNSTTSGGECQGKGIYARGIQRTGSEEGIPRSGKNYFIAGAGERDDAPEEGGLVARKTLSRMREGVRRKEEGRSEPGVNRARTSGGGGGHASTMFRSEEIDGDRPFRKCGERTGLNNERKKKKKRALCLARENRICREERCAARARNLHRGKAGRACLRA